MLDSNAPVLTSKAVSVSEASKTAIRPPPMDQILFTARLTRSTDSSTGVAPAPSTSRALDDTREIVPSVDPMTTQ